MPLRLTAHSPELARSLRWLVTAHAAETTAVFGTELAARNHLTLLLREVWPQVTAVEITFGTAAADRCDYTTGHIRCLLHQVGGRAAPLVDSTRDGAALGDLTRDDIALPPGVTGEHWRRIARDVDTVLALLLRHGTPHRGPQDEFTVEAEQAVLHLHLTPTAALP
ncbi:hypothetical protein CLV63_11234 [Murinocardiopsis flavida]|uniref:Uncharacterized protein n=1 Tax=Murinocardiopsis flavida TaxID=645275 RepID=A0A2P8DG12_9ACTN|nr:hypothetical protein [Murinocardiopsis flavida]PSK96152.1 hypothetical protein CLV63_11234 [Murinocardiopsis flavida]